MNPSVSRVDSLLRELTCEETVNSELRVIPTATDPHSDALAAIDAIGSQLRKTNFHVSLLHVSGTVAHIACTKVITDCHCLGDPCVQHGEPLDADIAEAIKVLMARHTTLITSIELA